MLRYSNIFIGKYYKISIVDRQYLDFLLTGNYKIPMAFIFRKNGKLLVSTESTAWHRENNAKSKLAFIVKPKKK